MILKDDEDSKLYSSKHEAIETDVEENILVKNPHEVKTVGRKPDVERIPSYFERDQIRKELLLNLSKMKM